MKILLEDERLITYSMTNDAVEAFIRAVYNGQARLAMEILVPIIESIYSFMSSFDEAKDQEKNSNIVDTSIEQEDVKKSTVKKPVVKKDSVEKQDEEE